MGRDVGQRNLKLSLIYLLASVVLLLWAAGVSAQLVLVGTKPHYFGGIPDVSASLTSGVRLDTVRPDSPAEKAGLQAGDIIVRLGEVTIGTLDDFLFALRSTQPERPVEVIYTREGQEYRTEVTLEGRR